MRVGARVADPVAELVGDREAVAAGRRLARHGLGGVDDDQPLGGDQHPGAVAEVALLDPQAEEVLGDRLDRDGDLVHVEGREVLRAELVRARVGVPGRRGRQRFVRRTIKSVHPRPISTPVHRLYGQVRLASRSTPAGVCGRSGLTASEV